MKGLMMAVIATLITATMAKAIAQQQSNTPPAPIKLEDYAAKNDIAEPAGVQFVMLRCAALHMFTSNMLKNDRPDLAANYDKTAKSFLAAALDAAKDQEFVTDQVPRMIAMYSDRARAARAATGNIFEDPILHSDILFCKRVTG
jgi:hypothetical protein